MIELGGNITLVGFKDIDHASMLVLKKIIGNYVKKFSENHSDYERLKVTMKPIHKIEDNQKFEINTEATKGGKSHTCNITDKNLFFAIDSSLKKIEKLLSK
ncbi:hypothetical protein HOD20_03175 [archaeon]|jgi:hypothetical protein|nr:hypothetical protein [archaeon]MBT4648626.1 hypothetical protein [archaeon]MBT6822491.1 hypothetical protein [archaeon]MBT7392165.1 hypothetical protein [archaeon]